MHEKLDEWLKEGIITPVEEPTDWVSSLAYSRKANGKLRICLDPKDLNAAIKRDHYKTPTVEEITHKLAGSRKFTKLDGTSSYLCIILDYESSLLTTFNTPWGRYRFIRLPFGLACSQDIFQRMIDQILEHCEGVIGIADDVVVHGKDDEEHDRRLHNLMRVAREHGLVFNREKCDVKTTSVTFFGTVYDKDGAHPDPKKVEAIHKMPPPEEPQELQKFLGMTTYLPPFIPSLSTFTTPLRELLWKDSEFTWNDSYQEAFDAVKQMVCKDTTLRYFDSRKPIVIQVDASQKGLGAALLQDGRPIAFTSKALTPMEQRYANIEREMLACVFGAEQFHTYVFGRSFTIESDHKPFEQINLKNLADTPARLQRMLLHLQNYNMKITYCPGREMLVADTLSCYADAMKKDDTPPGNIAPATPEWPGAPPAHLPPTVPTTAPVAPATTPLPTVPTAKTSTPHKTAACTPAHSPAPPTGVAQQQTGAAPAAPRRSARATKPNKRLIEEM